MTSETAKLKIQQIIRDIDSIADVTRSFATEDAKQELIEQIETAIVALDSVEDIIDGDTALENYLKNNSIV